MDSETGAHGRFLERPWSRGTPLAAPTLAQAHRPREDGKEGSEETPSAPMTRASEVPAEQTDALSRGCFTRGT